MSAGFSAYPLAAAGFEGAALATGGVLIALAAPFFVLWLEGGRHHPDSGVRSTRREDMHEVPDAVHDPNDPPETIYHYTGQHVSDANEIGYGHREKRFVAFSFQNWAMHMYGQRYRFLTGVALAVARRRYKKWRRGFPGETHTPLPQQIRTAIGEMSGFESPSRRRKYTRSQLYAL